MQEYGQQYTFQIRENRMVERCYEQAKTENIPKIQSEYISEVLLWFVVGACVKLASNTYLLPKLPMHVFFQHLENICTHVCCSPSKVLGDTLCDHIGAP